MYIATNESRGKGNVINVLPIALRRYMININFDEAEEIRIIKGKPLAIRYPDGDYYLTFKGLLSQKKSNTVAMDGRWMSELFERITKSSLYSVNEEIKNGYITIDGGHRVGLAGTGVTENGQVTFIREISALNIRIANEVIGVSDKVVNEIDNDGLKNLLVVSPPGAGKTTLLRDIARNLSERGYNVAIADERCELAAMRNGQSAFELGDRTVVLDNCPKAHAMQMLLRSMSPDVIITDEIGTEHDAEAIYDIVNSGVSVIASAHGRDIKQLKCREQIKEIMKFFEVTAVLSKRNGAGTIEELIRKC